MKKSRAIFVLSIFFCVPLAASIEQLATTLHRSFKTTAINWQASSKLLAQEKQQLKSLYSHALHLLDAWYDINGATEEEILDGLAREAGYQASEKMRWQISALIVVALDMQTKGHIATLKSNEKGSSTLYKVYRLLKGSWHVLLVIAFIVYYGWDLLAKLFPQLAKYLKKLLQKKWRSQHSLEVEPPSSSQPEKDVRNESPRLRDLSIASMENPERTARHPSSMPPPPPHDGGDDANYLYAEPEPTWHDTIVKNGDAIRVATGAARDLGLAAGGLAQALFARPAQALCQGIVGGVRAGMQNQEPYPSPALRGGPMLLALPAPEKKGDTTATEGTPGASSVLPTVAAAAAGGAALYGAYSFGRQQRTDSGAKPATPQSTTRRRDDEPSGPGQPPGES